MMSDYTIEKNIYLHFSKKDKEKISEILGVQINNNEVEIIFNDIEILFNANMINEEHYEELEKEYDVTSYIILFN